MALAFAGGCVGFCCLSCYCTEQCQRYRMKNAKDRMCSWCNARPVERLCRELDDTEYCKVCWDNHFSSGHGQYYTYLEVGAAVQHGGTYPKAVEATGDPLKED